MMEPQIVPFSAKSFQIYSWQTAGWRKALKAFSNPSLCWYLHISLKKQAIRLWIFNIKVNFAIELKASKCLTIDTEKSLSSIDFVFLGSGERWSRGIPHDAGRQQVWWGGRQEETILFMTMMTFIMFRQAGSVRKDRRGFAGNKEKTNENQMKEKCCQMLFPCRECGNASTSKLRPSKARTSTSCLRSCWRWRRRRCCLCSRSRTRRRRRRSAASCNPRQRTLQPPLHSSKHSTHPSFNYFLICPDFLK